MFVPKGEEVTGAWREWSNEEFHRLYCLPNIIIAMNSRSVLWTGHVARIKCFRLENL